MERSLDHYERWNNPKNTEDPYRIRTRIQDIMQDAFGVFRDGLPMEKGLAELEELKEQLQRTKLCDTSNTFNMTRFEMLELDNLIDTALVTARSSYHRDESRGAHYRYDYPKRKDDDWIKHTVGLVMVVRVSRSQYATPSY